MLLKFQNFTALNFIDTLSRYSLAGVILSLPIILWGAANVPSGAARVHDWLPDHQIERQVYNRFLKNFGDDQFILVTWHACRIDDPRVELLCTALRQLDRPHETSWLAKITTTQSLLDQMTKRPSELTLPQARKRLEGFVIGENGTACLIIELTPQGTERNGDVIALINRAADQVSGLNAHDLILAGPLFEEVSVDRAGDRSLRYLVPPSTLAALLVAFFALGKWRSSLFVFILAGLGQLLAMAMIFYTGSELSAVMIVLPTLVFMLTLSSAVHLVNYYSDIPPGETLPGARALLLGLNPVVLATVTTMVGMGSLAVSELAPVRNFGQYTAVGLGLATVVVLLMFAALTKLLLWEKPSSSKIEPRKRADILIETLTQITVNHHMKTVVVSLLFLLASACGVWQLSASTKFDQMFAENSDTIQGMQWVEKNIGPIVSVEVLTSFDSENQDCLQQIRWLNALQSTVRALPEVGGTLSAADFLPPIPREESFRARTARMVYRRRLTDQLTELENQHWVATDATTANGQTVWRMTCKVTALKEDYGFFIKRLRTTADSFLSRYEKQLGPPVSISLTGLSTVAYDAQVLLITDLAKSFLLAFVLITPMMILVVRSVPTGLLLMLPNILPPMIVFGTMGWLQANVDIAGILTASVALGIAVDDTLHFISWYNRGLAKGLSAVDSVRFAFRHCAIAMIQTTLICCAAMIPLLFADFIPTQRFASLMICMLALALVGDLLFLPALLFIRDQNNERSPADND